MAIEIKPYANEEQAAAARAFNDRMRAHNQVEYRLAERPPAPDKPGAATARHFYLAQDGEAVRGGFLLAEFPAGTGNGKSLQIFNAREPLSEGIIDSKYGLLGLRILKFMQNTSPYLFALGMGSESRPFPRLLKSAQWDISQVPFLFQVVRAGAFLREIRSLQGSAARRLAASAARFTGLGAVGVSFLHAKRWKAAFESRDWSISPVTDWGAWAEPLWQEFRRHCSLSVSRDLLVLREIYPLDDRHRAYLITRDGAPVAWVVTKLSRMRNHKYFGNLFVGTILDGVGQPEHMVAAVTLVSRMLASEGVELLVTNQSHKEWIRAFHAAGYFNGPSNYILALSPALTAEVAGQPEGRERMHFTRGDSDGRDNL